LIGWLANIDWLIGHHSRFDLA